MHSARKNNAATPGAKCCLGILLAALTASGATVAQQAPSARPAVSAPQIYRVINLGSSLLSSIPHINVNGQVTFSLQSERGSNGYFYNGKTVQDIGGLGGDEVFAVDLNDVGQVTGSATLGDGTERAFVWSEGGGLLDIGAPPGAGGGEGAAINNNGVVAGTAYGNFSVQAFRWSAASGSESLGAFLPGLDGISFSSALNDAGQITGTAGVDGNNRHAFAWTRAGGLADIDTLGSYDALPVAVGARGEVAGNRLPSTASLDYRAFLWTAARGMVDLDTTGGARAGVLAMTPGLHMVGLISVNDDIRHAMSWTPASGVRDLGTLGGASSRAYGVNARGQVVGYAQNAAGELRAFIWSASRGMQDLNNVLRNAPPGFVLDDALAINSRGAIVATSNAGLVLLSPELGRKGGLVPGPLVAPALVKAGVPLQAALTFIDEDRVGARSVTWSWGDGGSVQAGALGRSGSAGSASASHRFAAPGIYRVTATLVDRSGNRTAVSTDVVVTAASSATLAGSGTVMSPPGALRRAPAYAGPAQFRLLVPATASAQSGAAQAGAAQAGASQAGTSQDGALQAGETQAPVAQAGNAQAASSAGSLRFDLPGLNLRSQNVRLLGRQGAQQVFGGSGAVRGKDGYRFRLAVTLPGADKGLLGLKIWHTDPASKAIVIDYDNTRALSAAQGGRVMQGRMVHE